MLNITKYRYLTLISILIVLIHVSCSDKKESLFTLREDLSAIDFVNQLTYTEDFNPYTYRNFYNGGGVALGDINNDGWIDIYLTGNIVDNKLYLNQGAWGFKDITETAGVACANVWSTGASFVDVNGDGFLDLYVCKSGKPGGENRHNELFINRGDLSFEEKSEEYGLDVLGLSVHSAFFDYDKDGDLDCYVLNNSLRSVGGFDFIKDQRQIPDAEGNKFFENQDGFFVDITEKAGIYSSKIGYGLGVTLSDFNKDTWPDIFVSNDFFERDYLYINQQDGTFSEEAESYFDALSLGSMGADAADIDNDQNIDLFVTEMLPSTLARKKTKAVYDSWDKQSLSYDRGYHYQYPRNVLQKNVGNGKFTEISRYAGVAASEWSWASLIFDMNNDGLKDIFISNGIHKDLLDRDYLAFMANEDIIRNKISEGGDVIMDLIEQMPSTPIHNKVYANQGNFQFEDVSEAWGFGQETFSNGSAYGDLDNDGDLDLVVNNVNMPVHIYQNNTDTIVNKSISLDLRGKGMNTNAIGTSVILKLENGQTIYGENFNSRGFQSSISYRLVYGTGDASKVDSMIINWPGGAQTLLMDLTTNKHYNINEPDTVFEREKQRQQVTKSILTEMNLIDFEHQENKFDDFDREGLLYKMNSNEGPGIAIGDVNADGVNDIYIGGAKNQSSALFISDQQGYIEQKAPFDIDYRSEVTEAFFFDSDQDGDLDLYVGHGGKAFSIYSNELHDQLYINDGMGNFEKAIGALNFPNPISTSTCLTLDVNDDGMPDLFIGERFKTIAYGTKGSGYLFINQGNNKYVYEEQEAWKELGMITSAVSVDLDGDSNNEVVVVGEWMPVSIFKKIEGEYKNITELQGLSASSGLWNVVRELDIDSDGDMDLVCGNIGENNFIEKGARMYVGDFDENGTIEQIIAFKSDDGYYPIHDMDELMGQIPILRKKVFYYKDYAKASMNDLFEEETLNSNDQFDLDVLASQILINENGRFRQVNLPNEVQYSSVHALEVLDVNDDGREDIVGGGNQFLVKPQYGKDDASKGWILYGAKNEKSDVLFKYHNLNIDGQIRQIKKLDNDRIIVGINNEKSKIFEIERNH